MLGRVLGPSRVWWCRSCGFPRWLCSLPTRSHLQSLVTASSRCRAEASWASLTPKPQGCWAVQALLGLLSHSSPFRNPLQCVAGISLLMSSVACCGGAIAHTGQSPQKGKCFGLGSPAVPWFRWGTAREERELAWEEAVRGAVRCQGVLLLFVLTGECCSVTSKRGSSM